ncbi:MAG TPA: HD domain-containing phosphohydrolase [Thermoleophilaceae bacterium]|nr:HD domain-containing phosphohydrolase [Thermoleophilaceae bacterium]
MDTHTDVTSLVVQHDARLRELLCKRLIDLGVETSSAADPMGARRELLKGHVDLLVCDLDADEQPRFSFAEEVRQLSPSTATVGFGAHDDEAVASKVIAAGIDEYVSESSMDWNLGRLVSRALRRRDDRVRSSDEIERVKTVRVILQGKRGDDPLGELVLERLARAGRFRDEETAEHVERMSRSCALIARSFGWDPVACARLRAASTMHDLGKVGVPDAVLRKPGKLNSEERALIEAHAEIGFQILTGSGDELLESAAAIALTHQERFDGSGYPRGLSGDEIPIAGRIAAVADVFDALTHDRIYRSAFSLPEALKMMYEGSGSDFDPAVLEAFESARPEIERLLRHYPDSVGVTDEHPLLFAGPDVPARVLLVEEHGAIARGLGLLLRREGIEIAGTPQTVDDTQRLLERRGMDMLIVDPALEEGRALELIPMARNRGIKVLLYTDTHDASAVEAAHRSGAEGVIAKRGSPAEFVEAVQAVSRGERFRGRDVVSAVGAAESPDLLRLTAREREIATWLSDGLTGEQIAKHLFISPETVRTHVRNAMGRTGAKTRAHLASLVTSSPSG